MEAFEQRVKLFVSSRKKELRCLCKTRFLSTSDPERDTFRNVRDKLTDLQLGAADGSGAQMIVKTIRLPVGPKSTPEGCWISSDSIFFDKIKCETMRRWTRRFTLQYTKSWASIEQLQIPKSAKTLYTKTFEAPRWLKRQV